MINNLNKVKQKPTGSNELYDYFKKDVIDNYTSDPQFVYRSCDFHSIINYHLHDLEMTFGSIWIWSNPYKEYRNLFTHHVWNIDENDDVYDDINSLEFIVDYYNREYGEKMYVDFKKDGYKYVDGSKLKHTSNKIKDEERISKWLKKMYHKPLKTPKIIYLSDWSYGQKTGKKYTWERMEDRWTQIENDTIVKEIQR